MAKTRTRNFRGASLSPAGGQVGRRPVSRRQFLGAAGLGLAAASLPGCGGGESTAKDEPSLPSKTAEVRDIRFGIIALTDCSPLVIAHERGFFRRYGINATISKLASWAAIRDALTNGDIQGTHMLFGMPIASTMGLLGSPRVPMVIPWILNRNGQAITLKQSLRGQVRDNPAALMPMVTAAKNAGNPMTFAMTFPPGTHAMWMRYYLAAGGINPDTDVRLITVPPAQMIANIRINTMDGYCVGEPWNARAIAENIGFTSITTQEIWPDHPEKVCAFKADYAERNPGVVKDILKALHEASVWLDNMENRPEQARIISQASYVNCPPELILGRMQGNYDYGDGRTRQDPRYMIFSSRNCNYPQKKYVVWWLSQFRRWGMVTGAPDYQGVANQVIRADLYEEAMRELGYQHAGANNDPETLFDNVTFNPAEPEQYAQGFAVKNIRD